MHPAKVNCSMRSTKSGTTNSPVRLVQFRKAKPPNWLKLTGNSMLVKLMQPSKAPVSMMVTLSGIMMLVRLEHS